MTGTAKRHVTYAVIGAGFGGIGAAVRLKQAGLSDFVVFERGEEVGGTWRDNSYPGCACDVESQLYSFSFAPHAGWSRMYAPAAEILRYLIDCVSLFGVREHFLFRHEVGAVQWDERHQRWRVTTNHGEWTARFVILATGPLSEPAVPKLPGLDRFEGRIFHSARWDRTYDLQGKEIAVIGTGASAIQFVPVVQPLVKKLHLFQRTPPWVVPRVDRAFTVREKQQFGRRPWILKLRRWFIFAQRELLGLSFRWPELLGVLEYFSRRHMARAVKSRELREKLTPSYRIGCKRILISNDYYPAVAQSNVDVVTSGIREICARGVIDTEGRERRVDAIIFGTGFQVVDSPYAWKVVGPQGKSLGEHWAGSPKAYLGTATAGFPNLFMLLGPNTGLGHSSVVLMIEAQLEQVMLALQHAKASGYAALDVRPEAQRAYNEWLEQKSKGTVWVSGGCKSWYQDDQGGNTAIWPRSVPAFQRRLRRFVAADYRFW